MVGYPTCSFATHPFRRGAATKQQQGASILKKVRQLGDSIHQPTAPTYGEKTLNNNVSLFLPLQVPRDRCGSSATALCTEQASMQNLLDWQISVWDTRSL